MTEELIGRFANAIRGSKLRRWAFDVQWSTLKPGLLLVQGDLCVKARPCLGLLLLLMVLGQAGRADNGLACIWREAESPDAANF